MKKIYLLLCLCAFSLYAQDGTMDTSFHFNGSNGIAIGPFSDYGRICHLQDDGKMIAAGDVKNGSNFGYTKMGLVRYDNNGELDLSFGTNGVVVLYPNNQDHFISGIEHDAAGNLWVLGTYGTRNTVCKLSADGVIDTSFGTNGFSMDINFFEANKLVLLPDGKYLISGTGWAGSNRKAMVRRHLANGAIDTSFGTNGVVTISMDVANSFGGSLFTLANGNILFTGYYQYVENSVTIKRLFLTRLLATNGSVDSTYGVNGYSSSDETISFKYAKMEADASLTVLALRLTPTLESNYVRLHIDPNGNVISGETLYFWGSGNAVTMQPDGKMLFAGSYIDAVEGNGANCFFNRLNADGSTDTNFGTNGWLRKAFSAGNEDVLQIKVGNDGKIYFVGNKMVADFDFLVGRVNSGLVLGTESFATTKSFTVSPNPVDNWLKIATSQNGQTYGIYDLQGRRITGSSNHDIDVSHLASGVYVISTEVDNQVLSSQKFIKR